jgi:hypothetical protein
MSQTRPPSQGAFAGLRAVRASFEFLCVFERGPCFRSRLVCLRSCAGVRSSSWALQGSENQAAVLETELPLAFVDTALTIVPFPFEHTGGGKAALAQFPFQI